jgi:hypothetical protein
MRNEILLATLDAREKRNSRLTIVQNYRNIRPEMHQQRAYDAFGLLDHRTEKMLGLDLLILVAFGDFDAGLNGFLSSQGEFV